jgi:DNA-directed RNA polymerase specialized sigma24 family protein
MSLTPEQWALVEQYRHRAAEVARRYWRGNGDWDDVEDAAMWGLIEAASRSGIVADFVAFADGFMERAARKVACRRRPASLLDGTAESTQRARVDRRRDWDVRWEIRDLPADRLTSLLGGLSPCQREAGLLHHRDGLKVREIAGRQGVSESAAYGRVTAFEAVVCQRLNAERRGIVPDTPNHLRRDSSMSSQEPAGFTTGENQFVIRLDDRPYWTSSFLASLGWPHRATTVSEARKFATPADAVCHVTGTIAPIVARAVAEGECPFSGRICVVPEWDTARVIWPTSGAGPASEGRKA